MEQHTQPKPDFAAFAIALKSIQKREDCAFDVFSTDRGDSLPSGLSGTKCVHAARLLLAADIPALRAIGLWAMGRCLKDGEEVIYQGEAFGEEQLCLEAVRCDPLCSVAYCRLGYLAGPTSTVLLPDGRSLSNRPPALPRGSAL